MKFIYCIAVVIALINTDIHSANTNRSNSWSVKTAQSFIKRYPNPDSICWKPDSNHFSWQAGYIMFAMEKMWNITGDSCYFNYIKKYVDQQVDENGLVKDFVNDQLDNFLPGYAILFMSEQTHSDKYKKAAMHIRDGFKNYSRTSDGLFWHGTWAKNQAWVDGVFMGQIFLARYAKTIGDSNYCFDEIVQQMTLIASHCQKKNGLLLHGWDESKKARWADKNTGLSSEVWSEGLGWYAVLSIDILDYLPKNHPGYATIMDAHLKLCRGLKNSIDKKTGMWCQVVDKPDLKDNWNETSGTGMFVYTLKKSIKMNYINPLEYNPIVEKAYSSLILKAKYKNGFIDLYDCSSIGIKQNYKEYITQPKEISPFAAFGSFIIGTGIMESVEQ